MMGMAIQNLFSGVLLVLCAFDYAVSGTNSSFVIEPSELTTFIGASAFFTCSYPAEANLVLTWLIDGSSIANTNNSCVNGTKISHSRYSTVINGSTIQNYNLTIRNAIRECNNSILQCIAYESESAFSMFIDRSQEVILTLDEFPQVDRIELLGTNGTILITWFEPRIDPSQFINQAVTITYKLKITMLDDPFGNSTSISHNGRSPLVYLFSPHNPSACITLNISITAYLNSYAGLPRYMTGGSYDGSPPNTSGSVLVTSVTFNGAELIYEVVLSDGVPICYMNLIATNVFTDRDSEVYNITMKVDTRQNTTLTTFKVDNEKLPFDEHYNATISVYNPPSNLSNQLICFNLSTYDIQHTNLNNGLLMLDFVKNTSARGAFLVIGDTKSHRYDYVPVRYVNTNDTTNLEFNISDPNDQLSTCSSDCTLLVYVLKDDGLPNHNHNGSMMENIMAWPVIEYPGINIAGQNMTPETDLNSGQINNNNSVNATVTVNVTISSITFTCIIHNDSGDFKGCITIIHSTVNYSALIVNTIENNSNSCFDRAEGEEYQYAVFPWSERSGILGYKVITKGITQEQNEPSDCPGPGSDLNPGEIAAIVITVAAVILTGVIVVIVTVCCCKKDECTLTCSYCQRKQGVADQVVLEGIKNNNQDRRLN